MRGKKLLISGLTLAMLGSGIGGGCLMAAAAEADPQPRAGVTVGAILSPDGGYVINGSSSDESTNRTTLTYTPGGLFYCAYVEVTGATTSSTIELSLTASADAKIGLQLCEGTGWQGQGKYGKPIDPAADMTANTAFTQTISLATYTDLNGVESFYLGFFFDGGVTEAVSKKITFNTLTVDGVSYQISDYTPEVTAPDKAFKEYSDWTATNGTLAANTLEKLEGDAAEGTVDNGAAVVSITDPAKTEMTSDDGKKITALVEVPLSETLTNGWPTDWTTFYLKLKANNVSEVYGYFQSVNNCDECMDTAEWKGWHAFSFNLWSGAAPSVTEGYRIATAGVGGYIKSYMDTHATAPTKIVLAFVAKDGATEASVEIGGMTFGKETPAFINDIGTPQLEIGAFATWGQHTIATDETLEGHKGTKVSYNYANVSTTGVEKSFHATLTNFDAAKTPKLRIGFYTDSAITLAFGYDWTALTQHVAYEAGYHEVEVDFGTVVNPGFLRIWPDNSATEFEGTKNILIEYVTFYKDSVSVALGDASTGGLFNTPTYKDGKLSWTWDAKDAGGFYSVNIPVDNWHKFDRYLHINVTLSHETAIGIWGNTAAFLDDTVLKNSTHPKIAAGTYDMWLGTSTTTFVEGGVNTVMIYCDVNNASAASLKKSVTVNTIEFASEAPLTSSPNGNVVTVNYLEQKVTFESTYEVSTASNFASKLASGDAVTPGSVLYVRAADGSSAVTAITLPKVELNKDNAPQATVGENYIRFGAAGYEYKFGEDGAWTDLGSWGNLTADTEYTVYVRVKATATSFASDVVELKIKTTKSSTTPGGSTEEPPKEEEPNKGCGSFVGTVGVSTALVMTAICAAVVMVARKKKHD